MLCFCANHKNILPSKIEEIPISKKIVKQYYQGFFEAFYNASEKITFDEIREKFYVSESTLKKHLKKYLELYPCHLKKVLGFFPSPHLIITLAENEIGEINENNIMKTNIKCKEIVYSLEKPFHDEFLKIKLIENFKMKDGKFTANFNEFSEFQFEEYREFVSERGNSLVSLAGSINHEILLKALISIGLSREVDFIKTGNEGDGDIMVYVPKSKQAPLYCEVKSYHARERFARGLHDISSDNKIGVGFFIDPKEFGTSRTKALLKAKPMAIYMPDDTFHNLDPDTKTLTTTNGDKPYRPLSMFPGDMKYYRENGELPSFT